MTSRGMTVVMTASLMALAFSFGVVWFNLRPTGEDDTLSPSIRNGELVSAVKPMGCGMSGQTRTVLRRKAAGLVLGVSPISGWQGWPRARLLTHCTTARRSLSTQRDASKSDFVIPSHQTVALPSARMKSVSLRATSVSFHRQLGG